MFLWWWIFTSMPHPWILCMSLFGVFMCVDVCVCVCGFKDLVIHSTAVNSKHSPAPSDCVVRSFIPMVAMKDREMEMKAAGSDSRKYHAPQKTTKSYLSPETNNVGVSAMQATLPTLKTMAWTHLPVKKDKIITSSGCSYYYQSWHWGVFTRQLLIVFPDLILCPLSFPPGAFHLDSSTSLCQASSKPWAKYAVAAKVVLPPCPPFSSLSLCYSLILTRSVSAHLYFAIFFIFFPAKAQEQLVLSVEMQGLAKEFIEFVVQLSPWRQTKDLV